MKVKELKEFLAKMDDEQEINAAIPLGILTSLEDLKNKRLYMTCTFPADGIPLSDLMDDDDIREILDDESVGDISETVIEALGEWDKLGDLECDYISYELR